MIPWLLLIPAYSRSLTYEIQDDEVIVRVGIITKSVKHVPYRTVTNLEVKRDPFDRLLGLGTLKVQTAGMSGQTGAEESLVGLPNYVEIYETVAATLRRFRQVMAPTQGGEEPLPTGADIGVGVGAAISPRCSVRIRHTSSGPQPFSDLRYKKPTARWAFLDCRYTSPR